MLRAYSSSARRTSGHALVGVQCGSHHSFCSDSKLKSGSNCSVRSIYEAIRCDCQAIVRTRRRATILGRIKSLKADPDVLPTEVSRHVRDRTRPLRGSAEASRVLERVEIDHTLVDTHIVDAKDRGPLGRPWLTIAMELPPTSCSASA